MQKRWPLSLKILSTQNFTHWLIFNIPAREKIDGAIPGGKIVSGLGNARQGIGYGLYRYAGPKPPRGKQHLYRFTMYALDREIGLTGIPTKSRFMKIAGKYMIQRGNIIGKYE